MGKRRTHPLPGNRKFHAPQAKRVLQEAPGAAVPIPSQSSDPNGDPAGMDTQDRSDPMEFAVSSSENSGGKADPGGILVGEHGAGSPLQEGRDKEMGGGRALESPGISNEMEENHLELPLLGVLEADRTRKDELESPKQGILDEAGKKCPESPKPSILEVDGAGEEPPESVKLVILNGMEQEHLESSQLGILEGVEAAEEQLEPPQLRIPETDGAGEEEFESLKLGISGGTGEDQPESPKAGILEVDGAAEEQLETPTHGIWDGAGEEHPESVKQGIWDGAGEEHPESVKPGIWDGAGEEHPESVKPGISEADGAGEEHPEPLKQGIWDGAGENQLESPQQGDSGAPGSSPEDTVMGTAPAESWELLDPAGQGEEGALEEACGTGIALSMDTESPEPPREPQGGGGDTESRNSQSGNSSVVTPGLDPAATSAQDQQEGTCPELPATKPFPDAVGQQPRDTTGQIPTGSTGNSLAQPGESSARAMEPADASDVIRGLIRELSDLNRLAMGARRGLELLRRPKARRGRRPVPSGSRWKEG